MADLIYGRIIRAISGFYYVYTEDGQLISTHARGINRHKNLKPLVGDEVGIVITHEKDAEGSIEEVLQRKSQLIRPAVANADQALIVMSLEDPKANPGLLDRFLVQMQWQDMPTTICFNKCDIASDDEKDRLFDIYSKTPYHCICISAKKGIGLDELDAVLKGKITVVAGQSGAGKSTLVNSLQTGIVMETGEISKKLGRGKHTTRRAELIPIGTDSFIVDTPGFSSIDMRDIEPTELMGYFPEFIKRRDYCRFSGCVHVNEPDCQIKDDVAKGLISESRYESYLNMYDECKNRKRY